MAKYLYLTKIEEKRGTVDAMHEVQVLSLGISQEYIKFCLSSS